MLEAWDAVRAALPGSVMEKRASSLRRRCHDISKSFDRWHHDLSTSCASFTQEVANMLRAQVSCLHPEELPDTLIQYGPWYLFAWMMHWAMRLVLHRTMPQIYLQYPPGSEESIITAPDTVGSYCLGIARSVEYFLRPGHGGLMLELAMRIPVSFAQKVLSDPGLMQNGDPKLHEARAILENVGMGATARIG